MRSPGLTPAFDLAPYTYRNEHLREIAFPLGGIGTGCVSLDGRGGLRDWEIFNRPNKGLLLQYTFPMLWFRQGNRPPKAMSVQGPRLRDWSGEGKPVDMYSTVGHGRLFSQVDGIPGFESVEFEGTFPFARVRLHKPGCPLAVRLHAFNPFIPLDVRSSSFPGACLIYEITNTSSEPVDLTLAWSASNPVGEMAPQGKDKAHCEFRDEGRVRGLHFGNDRFDSDNIHTGTFALTTDWPDVTYRRQWLDSEWFDALQNMWERFRETGDFDPDASADSGRRLPGSLGCRAQLAPGQTVEIPFFFSWVMPVTEKYWDVKLPAPSWRPWYSTQWPTAWDAAAEFYSRRTELTERTRTFEDAFYSTTLPADVLERVGSSLSILHSPTVLRLQDGTFWAWEGCSALEGCCSGTCSHVWNYAVAHAHLFPEMQWNMRATEYRNCFNCGPEGEKGALIFRVPIPLGAQANLWHAASDGQLGGVVQLFRDWRLSGDDERLKSLWPAAKRALGYAWVQWDRDRDGLVDGDQHNTYDINFQGGNPLTQFFYLAALRAAEEIADHLGEAEDAAEYRRLYESGSQLTEKELWNGEYFIQTFDCLGPEAPKYQHGLGCLSDQVFGQLSASLAGLGDLVDPKLIRGALQAIYRHNFLNPLGEHENVQRVYAVSDEPGLILCTWPNGGRPKFPFPYSDEVWTGYEYQVASHFAFVGMTDEALAIVRGIRKRYDGVRRNPYNEFECGSHYARALASYGVFLALTGTDYDGRTRKLRVQPKLPVEGEFRTFVATPHGWGVAHGTGEVELEVLGRALDPS
ncbi:MAG TPA: GH116 family glycosyl-hydrolase [Fimbriimonadaceae bacterium]|nr:GH116 family glycosyl-hydrolase [Fimbriimonadaceae bacterium]